MEGRSLGVRAASNVAEILAGADLPAAQPASKVLTNLDTVVRLPTVLRRFSVGRSSLYSMIARGEFPRPIPLGKRSVGWLESELSAYLMAQIAKRDENLPANPNGKW